MVFANRFWYTGDHGRRAMIDRVYQLGYSAAYRVMKAYWAVRHPSTHGALVAVWHDQRVLLVRNSYLKYYSLPGGYVRPGETVREAAMRELLAEVGVAVGADALQLAHDETHDWEGKKDHVEIYQVELAYKPRIQIDRREVVAADLYLPEDALKLELFPPLRRYLEQRAAKRA
jgi:8-oxo-dGTP diphosphatase